MTDNTWILGVDLESNALKISHCQKEQRDIIEEMMYEEEGFSPEMICQKIHGLTKSQGPMKKEQIKIIFSGEDGQWNLLKEVEKNLLSEGFEKENIRRISRENAFLHYVFEQEEILRKHTVYLFDFDGEALWAYKMEHSKKKMPLNYRAMRKLLGTFTLAFDSQEKGKVYDEKFAGVLKQLFSKEVVSAVYLTGKGFEGDWLKKSLKILCDGRRAFVGQNLFSTGCCYYGKNMEDGPERDFMIQAPETVLYEAGVLDGAKRDAFYKITEAGNAWYDTKGAVDVLLERPGKIDIVFVNTVTGEKQVETVDLSDLGSRPRKVGRFQIRIRFHDSKTGVIKVWDQGFGEFLPTTHQLFFKEFTLL